MTPADPEAGLMLAAVALVPAMFSASLPAVSEVRGTHPATAEGTDQAAALRTATWHAAALIVGVSMMTRSGAVLLAGGLVVAGSFAVYRHALLTHPAA